MKSFINIILFLVCVSGCRQANQNGNNISEESQADLVQYINPLMGTDTHRDLSNGNIYPAIAVPWGMNFWTPQTEENESGWHYKYDAWQIRGLRQVHTPSPWLNDYGAFSLMPITGKLVVDQEERASFFSHKTEIVNPHYYKVYLADPDVVAEVSPTERAAHFQFTFPEADSAYLLVDAFHMGSMVKIIPEENKLVGYSRNNHGGVPDNFHNYFTMEFNKQFTLTGTWNEADIQLSQNEAKGEHVGAILGFKTNDREKITVKVASSFISPEQAQLNLEREIGSATFEETKAAAKARWSDELNRIQVEGGSLEQKQTFYTCLYRTLLFPRKFYELDQEGQMVHYSPYNGEVLQGYMFTDNGFWDTFRAVFPFFTLMYPEFNSQVMQGLVNTYKESGWLPEWASPGHRNVMIGSNSAAIIADSYLKGIRGYDIETLYEAILKNSENEGPMTSVGREGVEYYNTLGYVPYDVGIRDNASRTLEYAYDDFTICELAKALNRPEEEVERFRQRAMNYKHHFDPSINLMRGKNKDGSFQEPFNPFKWGDAFTEGNTWHYTWSVFQDVQGLMDLMGGEEIFVSMLDSIFVMPPIFDESYFGRVVHEIREMQIINMGQYAHGNQPIQHMIYLYNYAGQPWKAQYWSRQVMERLYKPVPGGYCGDEDNGQTSAWYVFSALGFYPVCPGSNQYVIGSPLFDKVTLQLENGNTLEIITHGNSPQNVYIDQGKFNGQDYPDNFLQHADLQAGGKLEFFMSAAPNKTRGINPENYPFSLTTKNQ